MPKAKKVSVKGLAKRESTKDAKARAQLTRDSFQNFVASVGINTANVSSASGYGFNPISNQRTTLEWMYRGSWICGKAVDCVADDMTRAGVELGSVLKPDQIERINTAMSLTGFWSKLNDATKWARLYGGAIAVILIDGQNMASPLNVKTIGKGQYKGLQVFDRWQSQPSLENIVTDIGPELGKPKFYEVVADAPALRSQVIHHSRCFRLLGDKMPYWQALNLNLWGASVLERIYDRLVAFDSTTQGAAQLVYKAYLRTLKIGNGSPGQPGLREIIASGGEAYAALVKQVEFMRLFQVNEGITMIDGTDNFETHAYSFGGLADVLLQFGQQLSGATGIPLVRLFGQSPAGLNSTGESDLRNYYDGVTQQQEIQYRNPLDISIRCMAASEGIQVPEGFSWSFRPLWQLTAKEKAEVSEIKTRTALAPYESGIVNAGTVLKELRTQSIETGVWTNITDEEIAEADALPLPSEQAESLAAEGEEGLAKTPSGESASS